MCEAINDDRQQMSTSRKLLYNAICANFHVVHISEQKLFPFFTSIDLRKQK